MPNQEKIREEKIMTDQTKPRRFRTKNRSPFLFPKVGDKFKDSENVVWEVRSFRFNKPVLFSTEKGFAYWNHGKGLFPIIK